MENKKPINIIFDGPPSHRGGRFIEVETDDGESIKIGEWIDRGDGYWALRISELPEVLKHTLDLTIKDDAPNRRDLIGEELLRSIIPKCYNKSEPTPGCNECSWRFNCFNDL